MHIDALRALIPDVPDFPEPGVSFKDITPLIADAQAFARTSQLLAERLDRLDVEEILAIESRGFIFGAAVAHASQRPLHLVRKPGKLPRETIGLDYELEYGSDRVEIHRDVIRPGTRYGLVDDVLATGGTAAATAGLVAQAGGSVAGCAFVVELAFLNGRARLGDCPVESLIVFD